MLHETLERPHVRVRAAQRGARGLFLSLALGYGHTRMQFHCAN